MEKHAFLIMAHSNYKQLDQLIELLDHERIDIFLHIDKRSIKYDLPVCRHSKLIQIMIIMKT